MRRVWWLILLLILPTISADSSNSINIEVEDPTGQPLENCQTEIRDPWSGTILQNPTKGMYQPYAFCEGYVVMWHQPVKSSQTTVVLEAYPIIDDLFTVENVSSIVAIGADWDTVPMNNSVTAPQGVSLIILGEGGSAIRTVESHISLPSTLNSYNLSGNYSQDIEVIAVHSISGAIIHWVNQTITVGEYGNGWSARILKDGLPIGNETWPPTREWVSLQLNTSEIKGQSILSFDSPLNQNQQINGTWQANHKFSTGVGLPFIPGSNAGIQSQVLRFLNGDENELENILETIDYSSGIDSHCCIIDDSAVNFDNVNIEANIDLESGVWGWNESANISIERSHLDIIHLEVPFSNDIRQLTPITFETKGVWQYLSSPLENWINGSSERFTLDRSQTSINGLYVISMTQNYPPEISINYEALPWENEQFELIAHIDDSHLSTHLCLWNIDGESDNSSLNLSSFEPDTLLSVSINCTDEGGLSGYWEGEIILDDEFPWINATTETQIIPPGAFNWNLMIGDDHDENLTVYWTSNKSEGWWSIGDQLETNFHVNSELNSETDSIEDRHNKRNPIEYWLAAEISDDAGHTIYRNWTIQLSDIIGPTIRGQLEFNNGGNWENKNLFNSTDVLRLNLTPTFDDHSAIENVLFEVKHINGTIENNLTWNEIQFLEFPNPGSGFHLMEIKSWDEVGNIGASTVGIAISPSSNRDLEIVDIKHSGGELEPGKNVFWITIQNNGASTTEFILCSGDKCKSGVIGPSSYNNNATTIVHMETEMGWFETYGVELSYIDENNNTIVKTEISEYSSGAGIGGLELLLIVTFSSITIYWLRTRNEARF
ncbi:MAG: hypothetical protein QGI21_04200 [Candidatus Poseidoniaceae archaeon]|jgi:hypothetical protein|nr:hypothetical protein [Candidatus Poseidoniaceae archaeon]